MQRCARRALPAIGCGTASGRCCVDATATATPRSTATPRTTRIWCGGCSSCSRRAALSIHHAGMMQVAVAGPRDRADVRALWRSAGDRYLPNAVLLPLEPSEQDAIVRLLPWTADMVMRDGRPTAYVCRDFACQTPV